MPNPYIPSFLKAALEDSKPIQLTFDEVKLTNIQSTSSFLYDSSNAPLKNTQQLNIDWSKFENHTFFSSAEAKVNLAFEQIINGYPFDGSKAEIEAFFERMTGFDKWVFDSFPRYQGQLHFSGTAVGEDTDGTLGTWIKVKDHAGSLYPEISKNKTGDSILNPRDGVSFTIEAQLFVPAKTNNYQVIFQKMSGSTVGLCLYLEPDVGTTSVTSKFVVLSGSSYVVGNATLNKGEFNHICATLNRESSVHYVDFYVNEVLQQRSRAGVSIGDLDIDASDILIGTGSAFTYAGSTVTPTQTLSGSMDELRVFHSIRTQTQQELFAKKSIYSTSDLKLYYRFNEPPPPLTTLASDPVNSIILDSSGNSLHATVANFTGSLRQSAANDAKSKMIYEKSETLPVLFPAYPDTVTLNETLIASASAYDAANPNLITRLIPQHYLLEGGSQDGTTDVDDGLGTYGGDGMPGEGKMSPSQIIVSFLYIWARFFDEIKLYVDSFSTLQYLDYGVTENTPNNFLYDLVRIYGFHLPPLFNGSTIDQYVNAENVGLEIATSAYPLKYVQNELLRRVLINMPDVLRSKGTQHSIRSFLRAIGIDPDNSMRIREFGGPTTRPLTFAREKKHDAGAMVEFTTSSLAVTPFLSASRIEPGYPNIAGTFVDTAHHPPTGISNLASDGLLTSGSWTYEAIYKFTPTNISQMTAATQSLARLCVTGSGGLSYVANLLAISSSTDPKVLLYVRPGMSSSSPVLRMEIGLPENGFFDSSRWNVCFGRERADNFGSRVSSSYFLRVGSQNEGEITWYYASSSFFYETPQSELNTFTTSSITSTSGSFISIGQNQLINSGTVTTYLFLNNTLEAPEEARTTAFTGRVANVRFWSKALSEIEWKEHIRNYKSVGVQDPLVNYNYVTTRSGSWEKLRLDSMKKQQDRYPNATASLGPIGSMQFIDFSQNGFHFTGSNFQIEKRAVVGEIFDHSYLSPYFDEASTTEKIRIRGYQTQDLVDATPWASVAPVHEIIRSERPTDDTRLSIEFSLIDALNRDIVTLFSTFDALDNALGSPELVYSPDYPDLDRMREVYFNRISTKLNFQDFFEFFRWFDRSLGTFIEQLVPRKTRFKGTNFVVESHMLERAKLEHKSADMYLAAKDRSRLRDVLLVQQIVGTLKKYLQMLCQIQISSGTSLKILPITLTKDRSSSSNPLLLTIPRASILQALTYTGKAQN